MTRRERAGLIYLPEAARTLGVSWVVFEKALYHPTVSTRLSRRYRKRWGHPRRVRVLTAGDLAVVAAWLSSRGLSPGSAPSPRASSRS